MAVDTKNIQSYHGLKEKGNKGKVTLKLFKRKDEDKIQQKKKKLKISTIKGVGCHLVQKYS